MITQFILAMFATLGCCIIFHLPYRCMPVSAMIGAVGWTCCQLLTQAELSIAVSTFIATLLVALLGEVFSRVLKDAATLFVIPGIIPLVPGGGMYYTMLYFIQGDMASAGEWGTRTVLIAIAIAIALLVMSSIVRIIVNINRKFSKERSE